MSVVMNGKTYYRTAEVCQIAGIARNTLFRWIRQDILSEPVLRDRRGWRVFTKAQIDEIKAEVNRLDVGGRHTDE